MGCIQKACDDDGFVFYFFFIYRPIQHNIFDSQKSEAIYCRLVGSLCRNVESLKTFNACL